MGEESNLWRYVNDVMKREYGIANWLADRLESGSTIRGIPDICYSIKDKFGFIELKIVKQYPVRETTRVNVKLTNLQKYWLKRRGDLSGSCYVLVKILSEKEYFIFNHINCQSLGELTRKEMYKMAELHWKNKINPNELYFILSNS